MSPQELRDRHIPYASLSYSTEAFIDYRIPGCGPKKNYALIGPGVSQSAAQPISLREKHGFQVGGVAMPPGVTNPPHMHFTAEVFMCMRGRWDLHWGFNPERQTHPIGEGDVASMPTWIYRGFQSLGTESGGEGFMFTGLGQDDTGGILWGPQTLEAARAQGVHLTSDYKIIDEQAGGAWQPHFERLQPMTADEIAALKHYTPDAMRERIVRFANLAWQPGLLDSTLPGCGAALSPVIGTGMNAHRDATPPIANPHGFSIEWLRVPPGGRVSMHRLAQKQVVALYRGHLQLTVCADAPPSSASSAGDFQTTLVGGLEGWDSYALPAMHWRSFQNTGTTEAYALLMTPGDERKRAEFLPDVVTAAGGAGIALDANGYLAPKRFTDRSQR